MRKRHLTMSLAALGSSVVLAASLTQALTIGQAAAAARARSSSGQLVATGTVTAASGDAVSGAKVSL
jgi:hypothetical protein